MIVPTRGGLEPTAVSGKEPVARSRQPTHGCGFQPHRGTPRAAGAASASASRTWRVETSPAL